MSVELTDILCTDHPLGRVLFWPSLPVAAGSYGTWTTKLVIGERPIRRGGAIALARRWASDWGRPQWHCATSANYIVLSTNADAELVCHFDRIEAWHPWDHVLRIAVRDGELKSGASLSIIYGDRRGGGPGARAQTSIEEASAQSLRIDPEGTGTWIELGAPAVEVTGGPVSRLVAVAPSKVALGQPFKLLIRAEDEWGNPAPAYEGLVEIGGADIEPLRFDSSRGGSAEASVRLASAGIHRLAITDHANDLSASSNPIECVAGSPPFQVRWGDIHGQSQIGCGSRSLAHYFAHARDVAGLDFASHQANDFLVSNADWEETQKVTAQVNEPGRFISLLGIEWSGETRVGGDRNVYFPSDREPIRRSSHRHVSDCSDIETDLPTIGELHRHYHNADVLLVPHVGGRTADLHIHDARSERLVEIHSTHATSEWFFTEALARGMRVGVTAGSDGVDGRPGCSHPGSLSVRNLRGGLVAVEMPALTREALWQGLRARRCYATTGERIILDVEAGGHRMGEEFDCTSVPTLRVSVHGTAPLEAVAVHRGLETIFSAPLIEALPPRRDLVRIAWRGAASRGNWQRARQVWDGEAWIEGATIRAARGYAFDSPAEGLCSVAADRVSWRSITAGDWDGVILEVDGLPSAQLHVRTGPASFEVTLGELDRGPFLVPAVGFNASVEVRWLAEPLPLSWQGVVRDEAVEPGVHPYWVHVRQEDGEQAWSSPIYINYVPDR
jgi:hypothetical protein